MKKSVKKSVLTIVAILMSVISFSANAQGTSRTEPITYTPNHGSQGWTVDAGGKLDFNGKPSIVISANYIYYWLLLGIEADINCSPNSFVKGHGGKVRVGFNFPSPNSPMCRNLHMWVSPFVKVGVSSQWDGNEKSVDENGTSLTVLHGTAGLTTGTGIRLYYSPRKNVYFYGEGGYQHDFQNAQFEKGMSSIIANLPPADKQQVMSGCHGNTVYFSVGVGLKIKLPM